MPPQERELLPLGTGFDVVRRGYDRAQVEEYLDGAEADLRILTADRDAAVGQASELARALDRSRAHIEDLRGQIDRLSAPPDTMEGLSERLQRMLRLAQDEAREMRTGAENAARTQRQEADAHARATIEAADEKARATDAEATDRARRTVADAETSARGILDEARRQARELHERAEAEAGEVRVRYDAGVADNDRRRTDMETEHTTLMETARSEAARVRRESEQERDRLDHDSDARRRQVEEDFEIAMAARRSESMRVLARGESDARARAEKQLREAAEEARRRIRAAEADVADIRRLRTRVSEQLATLRAALVELPGVDAFPDEQGDGAYETGADGSGNGAGGHGAGGNGAGGNGAGGNGAGGNGAGNGSDGARPWGRTSGATAAFPSSDDDGLPRRSDPAIPRDTADTRR